MAKGIYFLNSWTPVMLNRLFFGVSVLLFFLLFVHCESRAEDALDLKECVAIGLKNAVQVRQKENQLKVVDAQLLSSYGKFLPSVEVGVDYVPYTKQVEYIKPSDGFTLQNGSSGGGDAVFVAKSVGKEAKYYIRSSLTLFDGLANFNSLAKSRHEKKTADSMLQREKEKLVYDIVTLYYQLMLDQELLKIAKQNYELSKNLLKRIDAKVKLGDLSLSDLYQQQAKVSEDNILCLERANKIKNDQVNLLVKIGLDPAAEKTFEDIPLRDEVKENILPEESVLIKTALRNRADYIASSMTVKANKASVSVAKAEYFPKISLVGEISGNATYIDSYKIGDTEYDVLDQSSLHDRLFDEPEYLYALSLRWNVFDGFLTNLNVQKSRIVKLNSEVEYDDLKRRIIADIKILLNDYSATAEKVKKANIGLKAAKQAYEVVSMRYDLGLSDYVDLSKVQSSLVEAQSQKVQSLYNFDYQKRIISYYTGKDFIENIL